MGGSGTVCRTGLYGPEARRAAPSRVSALRVTIPAAESGGPAAPVVRSGGGPGARAAP
ncbi:hypothetical protein J2852_000040 [Azospirillum soli]|nr:hypothetical protein [Azospirillum soli]